MSSEAVVNLIVNADDAEGQIDAQVTRIANDAERGAPRIDLRVNIDNSSVVATLNQLSDRLAGSLDEVNDNLVQTNDLLRRIGDNDGLRRVGDDADDAEGDTNRLNLSFGDLSASILGAVGSAARLTVVGGVASQAIPLVAALASSVASIAPAAAAGVTGFVALKTASATLKVALLGVSDAIGAVFDPNADPAALEEALKNLSDNARSFVLVLNDMKPALDDLRLDIQGRTFRGLDQILKQVATATFPALRRATTDYAESFNKMARGIGSSAVQLGESGTLGRALDSSTDAFEDLEKIPGQVVTAIGQLAAAGGPLLNKLSSNIEKLADRASKSLGEAFESGRLEQSVNAAGDVISQLGRIAGNVFGAIGNVLSVASEQGDGLFGTLEKLTGALEEATASQGFKDALSALIGVGATLVDTILPLITEAFKILGPVIEELAPPVQELISLIGEKLLEFLPVVAPLIEQIAILFGQVLTAVQPLIEEGINILIEIMPSLVELFEALSPLIEDITPFVQYFAVGAKEILVPALEVLIEVLIFLIGGIRQVIMWVEDIGESVIAFAEGPIADTLTTAVRFAAALLKGDWSGAWEIADQAVQSAGVAIVRHTLQMGIDVRDLLTRIFAQVTRDFITAWNGLVGQAQRGGRGVINAVAQMGSNIVASVNRLIGGMYQAGINIVSSLVRGMLSQLGSAVSAARRIVGGIRDFFPSSPAKKGPFSGRGYPFFSGQAIVNSLTDGIESRSRSLDAAMGGLLKKLPRIPGTTGSLVGPNTGVVQDGTGFAGIANTTFARLTPNVNVYIGNRQLNDYMQVVVDENSQQRDRLAAQGVRSN